MISSIIPKVICPVRNVGYEGEDIHIPHKKPRKSKNNPNPELLPEQKKENRVLSQVRVLVEHAIGGMKRFQTLVQAFRNRKDNFVDEVVGFAAPMYICSEILGRGNRDTIHSIVVRKEPPMNAYRRK